MRTALTLLLLLLSSTAQAFEVCDQAKDPAHFPAHDRWAVIAEQGLDGWIFARGELAIPADLGRSREPLRRLAAALKARGVTPYLVDVPGRLAVAESKLDPNRPEFSGYRHGAIRASYGRKVDALEGLGWNVVDVVGLAESSGIGPDMYMDKDHHWSTRGEAVVADALAQRIHALPSWGALPRTAFTLRERDVAYSGTYRYIVIDKCGANIPATPSIAYKAEATEEPTADALLGDAATPKIVLVGTSQSRRQDYDVKANRQVFEDSFAALLRHRLGADVLNLAVEGGGTYSSLEAWLTSDEFQRGEPKVLIWEMNDPDGFEDLATLRRLIPAVHGTCSKREAKAHATGDLGRYRPILDVDPALGLRGADHYLQLRLKDGNQVEFEVEFKHGSRRDVVEVKRSRLLPNSGLFFIELTDAPQALESVTLTLPDGAIGSWDLRICSAP